MKHKKNPTKIHATMADVERAQRRVEEIMRKEKDEAVQGATVYVQGLIFMALHETFGFELEDFGKLKRKEDEIADRILAGEYSLDQLEEELNELGVTFE